MVIEVLPASFSIVPLIVVSVPLFVTKTLPVLFSTLPAITTLFTAFSIAILPLLPLTSAVFVTSNPESPFAIRFIFPLPEFCTRPETESFPVSVVISIFLFSFSSSVISAPCAIVTLPFLLSISTFPLELLIFPVVVTSTFATLPSASVFGSVSVFEAKLIPSAPSFVMVTSPFLFRILPSILTPPVLPFLFRATVPLVFIVSTCV